jgi:hypothetical protein
MVYLWDSQNEFPNAAMLPVLVLRSPVDASRFLFSSLSSLYFCFKSDGESCPTPVAVYSLLNIMLLLADNADSLSSLRRLVIADAHGVISEEALDVSFSPLARLSSLTECRIHLRQAGALSCSSLVSALSSLQSLTSLDMNGSVEAWPQLLQLLCADVATPLLLRLKSLVLPINDEDEDMDGLHDALLCRLSSLPSPPALQRFSGISYVTHRAAGLLSILSQPHLTQLDLLGFVRRADLSAFASRFNSAPLPLLSLVVLPRIQLEPDDGDRDEAAVAEDAAAVCSAARTLLSSLTSLRQLLCGAEMAGGVGALPGSLPDHRAGGCSGSLYSLTVRDDLYFQIGQPSRFPFTSPLSFPLLTELFVDLPMSDAELELLLSSCPQLLRLRCVVSENWKVLLIAARCCPGLLDLSVRAGTHPQRDDDAAVALPQPVASPFLPQLLKLKLDGNYPRAQQFVFVSDFSVLEQFTTPPHAQLRCVHLEDSGLTAQHVLALLCLPQLSHLVAYRSWHRDIGDIAEVEEASRRTQQRLLSRPAADDRERDTHRPSTSKADWDGASYMPLGPQQQQEMRQRVLKEALRGPRRDLLIAADGVGAEDVRAVFAAELRSVLTATVASRVIERRRRG